MLVFAEKYLDFQRKRFGFAENNLGWFVRFGVIVGFRSSQTLAAEQRKPLGGKVSFLSFFKRFGWG